MNVQVLSIGEPLARNFERAADACVLARYDSTLQLESDDCALWAITNKSNPAAMRIIVPNLPDWRDGAIVRVRGGKIFGAGCALVWDEFARFDPVPRQRELSSAQRAQAARTIAGALTHWQLADALGFWDELSEMWEPLARSLIPPESTLHEWGNGESIDELVLRLMGRGPGLTPTGDDFLQALCVTLRSGDAEDHSAFGSLVGGVEPYLSRTTPVSRAFFLEAMQGWTFGALKNVLDDLPVVTQAKIDALMSIGATSGPAYTFGVLMGLSWKDNCTIENSRVQR